MKDKQTVQIAYAVDGAGTEPCALSIYSALRCTRRTIDVHVLYADMSKAQIQLLKATVAIFPHASLHLHSLHDTAIENVNFAHHYVTRMALGRLMLPDVLSGRVVYLDFDTLVFTDIATLAEMELGENLAAAVRDFGYVLKGRWSVWRDFVDRPRRQARRAFYQAEIDTINAELGQPLFADYFNSGVLVLDCDRIASDPIVGPKFKDMKSAAVFRIFDQDWLNIILKGQVLLIDPKWNSFWGNPQSGKKPFSLTMRMQYFASRRWPAIVHFTSEFKPWLKYDPSRHSHIRYWFLRYRFAQWQFRKRLNIK